MNFQTCTKVPVVGSAPTKSKTVTDRGGGGMSEKSKRYSTRHLSIDSDSVSTFSSFTRCGPAAGHI